MTHDYTRKRGVVHTEILLPPHAPPSFSDRATLWNSVELYERLSHDDERAGESVSIENQKRILEDYAQKNGFTNIRHFTDDGVRGTTFKRPGLDAMLEEIRAGNVATVIIKDQSRIGRDVVEVGLLKRTFDEYHVRFIAANDNLDTANGFDIAASIPSCAGWSAAPRRAA